MQKKSNPLDAVNIISVVVGVFMIFGFIFWGQKRMDAIAEPAAGTTATAPISTPAGGLSAPVGSPAGSTAPPGALPGGPMLPMGGSSSAPPSPTSK